MTWKKGTDPIGQSQQLFERGFIQLEQKPGQSIEVTRGMEILTSEGYEAGQVAAVVVNKDSRAVTHLLLSRLRVWPEYRLVSINFIEQIKEEAVVLEISRQGVEVLPVRRIS